MGSMYTVYGQTKLHLQWIHCKWRPYPVYMGKQTIYIAFNVNNVQIQCIWRSQRPPRLPKGRHKAPETPASISESDKMGSAALAVRPFNIFEHPQHSVEHIWNILNTLLKIFEISSTPCWTYLKYLVCPVEGDGNQDKASYTSHENGARRAKRAAPHLHQFCILPCLDLHILR